MVSVEEATKIIQQNLWKGGSEAVPLLDSIGRVLAENVTADRDFPPFDRVTMDGIAISFNSFSNGQRQFPIDFIQAAGAPQQSLADSTKCCEVMTGAILPVGVDTVVRYEDVVLDRGVATIMIESLQRRSSIHPQGNDAKGGEILLQNGALISSAEIPLLASVGKSTVLVKRLPKVALISTGDELVDLDVKPLVHQIRKSNMFALASALAKYKADVDFFHLNDNEESISKVLDKVLLEFDLIILSGGVSKGKYDLIPTMLQQKNIQQKFHQISQRPGKPMLFGVGNNKTLFALPGNPVSTFLCYYKYIEPWLMMSLAVKVEQSQAILSEDFTFEPPLTYFLQVKRQQLSGQTIAIPVPGGGSGDFVNLREVDGFLELPSDQHKFEKGGVYNFIAFR